MRHRLESALALARLGVPSWIFSGAVPGRLARAVDGEQIPGTIVSVSGPVRN
jgi:isopentenyl phosphate kinase